MSTEPFLVIDFKDALDRVDGDTDLFFELVDGFVSEFDMYRNRLEKATQAGDRKEIKEVVHTIKGVLGNLSAIRGYKIASEMDTYCNDEKFDEVTSQLPTLILAVEEFFVAAEKLKSEHAK